MFGKYNSYIITESSSNNSDYKRKYKKYHIHFLLNSSSFFLLNIINLFLNCFISLFWFIIIRPKYIVTTGAITSGPMCCIGKILGSKIVFIETMANINTPTVTGKLVYKFADLFVVQWEEMLDVYPNAVYGGLII